MFTLYAFRSVQVEFPSVGIILDVPLVGDVTKGRDCSFCDPWIGSDERFSCDDFLATRREAFEFAGSDFGSGW